MTRDTDDPDGEQQTLLGLAAVHVMKTATSRPPATTDKR